MTPTGTLAIDIDLGRITAWSSAFGVVADSSSTIPTEAIEAHQTVLVETASPFFYTPLNKITKGEVINRLKWAIYNVAICADIYHVKPTALFSPSSLWTNGYPEDVREQMAGCAGKCNHDVRACISMIWFYQHSGFKWAPWPEYLSTLLKDKKHGKRRTVSG